MMPELTVRELLLLHLNRFKLFIGRLPLHTIRLLVHQNRSLSYNKISDSCIFLLRATTFLPHVTMFLFHTSHFCFVRCAFEKYSINFLFASKNVTSYNITFLKEMSTPRCNLCWQLSYEIPSTVSTLTEFL